MLTGESAEPTERDAPVGLLPLLELVPTPELDPEPLDPEPLDPELDEPPAPPLLPLEHAASAPARAHTAHRCPPSLVMRTRILQILDARRSAPSHGIDEARRGM
jgi:hypothetical protein